MTDKELLELAAKAAGVEIAWNVMIDRHNPILTPKTQQERNWLGHEYTIWNPLQDDGDALRLACKLGLWINTDEDGTRSYVVVGNGLGLEVREYGDPRAVTRRAIVRAAAEIGRSMK